MLVLATDWSTISALATGFGTLVLAIATFAAVRSSNRSARIAEMALQEQRRPFLTHSRLSDPEQKLMFVDRHWITLKGGQAAAEYVDGIVYLSLSVRNVGSGIAVCQAWTAIPGLLRSTGSPNHAPLEQFRPQTRDLFVPPGDVGMWQGALRDRDNPLHVPIAELIGSEEPISVELLYTDLIGAQPTVTRFALMPMGGSWYASMSRHWYLDGEGPRAAVAALTGTVMPISAADLPAVRTAEEPSL